jgi:hypothetical protein
LGLQDSSVFSARTAGFVALPHGETGLGTSQKRQRSSENIRFTAAIDRLGDNLFRRCSEIRERCLKRRLIRTRMTLRKYPCNLELLCGVRQFSYNSIPSVQGDRVK